jgi:hypothetical protein
MEEVEDGGELPHNAQPPPRQLGGSLGLHHERRHHAVLRRLIPRIPAPTRLRLRPRWRSGRGRRRRHQRPVVARAREPRPPRGQRRSLAGNPRRGWLLLRLILRQGGRRHRL